MTDTFYANAKKNLKKTNFIINNSFIKQQEIHYTKEEIQLKKINNKLDIIIEQNKNLKKINLSLLNKLNEKFVVLNEKLDICMYSDDESYVSDINDVEL